MGMDTVDGNVQKQKGKMNVTGVPRTRIPPLSAPVVRVVAVIIRSSKSEISLLEKTRTLSEHHHLPEGPQPLSARVRRTTLKTRNVVDSGMVLRATAK